MLAQVPVSKDSEGPRIHSLRTWHGPAEGIIDRIREEETTDARELPTAATGLPWLRVSCPTSFMFDMRTDSN